MLRIHAVNSGAGGAFHHCPIGAYIPYPRFRILGHPIARRKERGSIKPWGGDGNRDLHETSMFQKPISYVNLLLAYTSIDHFRLDRMRLSPCPLLHDLFWPAHHAHSINFSRGTMSPHEDGTIELSPIYIYDIFKYEGL